MKHYIIGKWKPDAGEKLQLLPRVREIFSVAGEIPGVYGAEIFTNCVARDNRYDIMIVISMEPSALTAYDNSAMHHAWKEEFGPLLEKKAIFDHE